MAGFDLDLQKSYTLPGGGRGEAGRIDFSEGSFCQAVPTRLLSMYAFGAHPAVDVTGNSYDLNMFENRLTVDIGDISNSNIIVKRSTMRNDLSASYYYEAKGW
jgi:hypothetical protein